MKKIFFIIPLLFINLSFNCINLYNNKTLIKNTQNFNYPKKILYLSGGTTSNGAVALKILYTIYYFTK